MGDIYQLPVIIPGIVMGSPTMVLLVALVAVGALALNVVDAEMPIDLQIEDLSPGKPCEIPTSAGDLIYVHYTGRTHPELGGHVFESTSNKKPIKFQLGAGRVIRGWDDGLLNMCPGARRRLIIPPSLDMMLLPSQIMLMLMR